MLNTQTLLSIAPAVSAVVALFAFIFSVWTSFRERRRESGRRDWERLQALAQILHKGPEAGPWAQKLAARELSGLKTKKVEALLLANEALTYWDTTKDAASPELQAELRQVVDKLSK
jgi:hypothetical protein